MRIIPDQLRSKNLVLFKKRQGRYKIPGTAPENEASLDRVDADLSPEEQTYVRHYLGYADALIRSAEENASPDLSEVTAPEDAQSSPEQPEERPEQQPTADEPASGLNESNAGTKDHPVKAA